MTERDPTGRDAHAPGAKLDQGKPRPDLVLGAFAGALAAVTDVGTFGANKYTDHGWRSVPDGERRYADAQLRHYLKRKSGEVRDPDSGLLHLAHEAWNALAILQLHLDRESQTSRRLEAYRDEDIFAEMRPARIDVIGQNGNCGLHYDAPDISGEAE